MYVPLSPQNLRDKCTELRFNSVPSTDHLAHPIVNTPEYNIASLISHSFIIYHSSPTTQVLDFTDSTSIPIRPRATSYPSRQPTEPIAPSAEVSRSTQLNAELNPLEPDVRMHSPIQPALKLNNSSTRSTRIHKNNNSQAQHAAETRRGGLLPPGGWGLLSSCSAGRTPRPRPRALFQRSPSASPLPLPASP